MPFQSIVKTVFPWCWDQPGELFPTAGHELTVLLPEQLSVWTMKFKHSTRAGLSSACQHRPYRQSA